MRAYGSQKQRGAFFTPERLADFLANWSVRSSEERILDPAAGDGALLRAASRRLRQLGAHNPSVTGVELHLGTYRQLVAAAELEGVSLDRIRKGDFFALCDTLGRFDVIVANPPYVRHHDVPRRAAERMRRATARTGFALDGRASSWAHFVFASIGLLKDNGRIAAILPSELITTDYGRALLEVLRWAFESLTVVKLLGRPFEDLQLTPVVLLGEGRRPTAGDKSGELLYCAVNTDAGQLTLPPHDSMYGVEDTHRTSAFAYSGARASDFDLLDRWRAGDGIRSLCDVAQIRIGYVSGDSGFFHLAEEERLARDLQESHLRRAIPRGSRIRGVAFEQDDWQSLRDSGEDCWVFAPESADAGPVRRYIRRGAAIGVSARAKCRRRDPWWQIEFGEVPSGIVVFLGGHPRVVANQALAFASNSLYTVRPLGEVGAHQLAIGSLTSLFRLHCAVTARRLGGGLSKLEVRDVGSAPVPIAPHGQEASEYVDSLARMNRWREARRAADDHVLRDELGMRARDIAAIQKAVERVIPQ